MMSIVLCSYIKECVYVYLYDSMMRAVSLVRNSSIYTCVNGQDFQDDNNIHAIT